MTLRELRNQIKKDNLQDLWWLAIDGVVQHDRIKLVDLQVRQARLANNQVQLINAYADKQSAWLDIELSPNLNLERKTGNPFPQNKQSHQPGTTTPLNTHTASAIKEKLSSFLVQKERELRAKEIELKEFALHLAQREAQIELHENQLKARMLERDKRLLAHRSTKDRGRLA